MKNNEQVVLDVQIASHEKSIPEQTQFKTWVVSALKNMKINSAEIGIRIVDEMESANLNQTYRLKPGPTNVLSFSLHHPVDKNILLGDLVFCAPLIREEAQNQQKPLAAHWAHLVIHGTLHLLGYDHIAEKDRVKMENLEINILNKLGYENPYESNL